MCISIIQIFPICQIFVSTAACAGDFPDSAASLVISSNAPSLIGLPSSQFGSAFLPCYNYLISPIYNSLFLNINRIGFQIYNYILYRHFMLSTSVKCSEWVFFVIKKQHCCLVTAVWLFAKKHCIPNSLKCFPAFSISSYRYFYFTIALLEPILFNRPLQLCKHIIIFFFCLIYNIHCYCLIICMCHIVS